MNHSYTKKQMGDACEMLVASELTLAGVPALKVPDCWPGYDVIAQQPGGVAAARISVKSRTYKEGAAYVGYQAHDVFDWLAIVLLNCPPDQRRRIFLIPREVADAHARRDRETAETAAERYFSIAEAPTIFADYENNFELQDSGLCAVAVPRRRRA